MSETITAKDEKQKEDTPLRRFKGCCPNIKRMTREESNKFAEEFCKKDTLNIFRKYKFYRKREE